MYLTWVNTKGGPLVCASLVAAKSWRGTHASSIGGAISDYERACDQTNYVGAIACASSQVLVLGDEPFQSAFVMKDECVLVVRWVSCISRERAEDAIAQLPSELPFIEKPTKFILDNVGLVLFDAALDGIDPAICARISMEPGSFSVTTQKYNSDRVYEFIVHRLIRDPIF